MNPLIQLKKAILAFIIALTCFGLSPMAQALLPPPPPDGDYSTGDMAQVLGDNMAVGADTLCNMMMLGNTPYGCNALEGNGTGVRNTAIGYRTLVHNAMGNRNTAIGFAGAQRQRHGEQQHGHRLRRSGLQHWIR